jgi:hypothetical protein
MLNLNPKHKKNRIPLVNSSRIILVVCLLMTNWVISTASANVPGAPTNLSGTPNGSTIPLSWTAPDNGGFEITDYIIEFRTGTGTWSIFSDDVGTGTSRVITGLNASTTYSFRVSASNIDGNGPTSDVLTIDSFCSDLNAMNGITGQILWLRADCVNGTRTQPTDNTEVTTWEDLSGSNNDATSHNADRRPTFRSDSTFLINRQPVINFARDIGAAGTAADTNGARFIVDGIDIRAAVLEDVSIFVVYKPRRVDGDENDILGVWGNDDGAWDRFFLAKFIQTVVNGEVVNGLNDGLISLGPYDSGLEASKVPDAGLDGQTRLLTAIYDGTVTDDEASDPCTGRRNSGISDSKIYFGSTEIKSFTDATCASSALQDLYIGWDGDGSSFRGDIAEFIVFDRALESDLPTINRYLNDRYNLGIDVSTNLPTVIHADPKSRAINIPPLTLTSSTNAMICFEQVSNVEGGDISGSADIAVRRTFSVTGVAATESPATNSWRYSGTRANVETQINTIQITGTDENPVVNSASKWIRVRVTASTTNCATSPVQRIIEIRPIGLDGFRRVTVRVD